MKLLKTYKLFEAQNETHWETYDIFHDFLDEFGYEVPEFVHKYPRMHNLQVHSRRYGGIEIVDAYHFGAKCLKIRINSSTQYRLLKPGNFKNFDGINNDKYSEMLQECHLRMIDFLNPVDVFVGSVGIYSMDLDLLYFYEKPDLKRYSGVDIYGSNIAVSLDKLGIDLISNSRHSNCFDAYKNGQIQGMFYLMGNYDGWYYTGKISEKDESRRNNKPLLDWIDSEWDEVCRRLKIKNFQKIKDYNNPKITIAEFLSILKKNQNNYDNYVTSIQRN
jgi:hypothetical protein